MEGYCILFLLAVFAKPVDCRAAQDFIGRKLETCRKLYYLKKKVVCFR